MNKYCNIPLISFTGPGKLLLLLFSVVIILSIMFIPIGVKLKEGFPGKGKPNRPAGGGGAASTRRASSNTLLITDTNPTVFEKTKLKKKEKKIKRFANCKNGTYCPNGIVCHSQSDCLENN